MPEEIARFGLAAVLAWLLSAEAKEVGRFDTLLKGIRDRVLEGLDSWAPAIRSNTTTWDLRIRILPSRSLQTEEMLELGHLREKVTDSA